MDVVAGQRSRANCQLRVVRPELTEQFAAGHDDGVWRCLCAICQITPDVEPAIRDIVTLPLGLGGLGLRSAFKRGKQRIGQVGRTRSPW